MQQRISRQMVAYCVGNAFAVDSASRTELLRTAYNNNAPHEVIDELVALPEKDFTDLDEVFAWLPNVSATA